MFLHLFWKPGSVFSVVYFSLLALGGCGGNLTSQVYMPAKSVWETGNFGLPELDDKRWNGILILPRIIAGNSVRPRLQICIVSELKGKSIFLDSIILKPDNLHDSDNLTLNINDIIFAEDNIHRSECFVGSHELIFGIDSREGQLLMSDRYNVSIVFREDQKSSNTLMFEYPIETITERYLLLR